MNKYILILFLIFNFKAQTQTKNQETVLEKSISSITKSRNYCKSLKTYTRSDFKILCKDAKKALCIFKEKANLSQFLIKVKQSVDFYLTLDNSAYEDIKNLNPLTKEYVQQFVKHKLSNNCITLHLFWMTIFENTHHSSIIAEKQNLINSFKYSLTKKPYSFLELLMNITLILKANKKNFIS